jgi:hypothetical protein
MTAINQRTLYFNPEAELKQWVENKIKNDGAKLSALVIVALREKMEREKTPVIPGQVGK